MAPSAAYQREYRRRRKEAGGRLTRPVEVAPEPLDPLTGPPWPADPAGAVAEWSRERLRVPPGHKAAGEAMELPAYAVAFFREALAPGVREAGCFVARKNAKSAAVAVLILAHLADDGPLRRAGWRCGVASINREKAVELWTQCSDIALASGLLSGSGARSLSFGKVPRVMRSRWGAAEFLSADKSAGHASGFDLAIADELGLFPERGRALVAGLRSSTSARDGRLLAISVLGDSPLSAEMVKRAGDPACVVHVHEAPKDCALDDEAAWHAANPALGTVKSLDYMRDTARLAAASPADQADFRAFDLNQPGAPSREMIVALDRWQIVASKPRPERAGPVYIGFDLGGSASLTAAALYWPDTGRLECFGACGEEPDLLARGEADGCGHAYANMAARGELRTWPGRVTPCGPFLAWIAEALGGQQPALALADRYRQAEALDALAAAGVSWPVEWRAQGSGKDGSADIRHFQRAVIGAALRPGESFLLENAIAESVIRYDPNGNPALDKRRKAGRIDALSAAVLAVGAGERERGRGPGEALFIPLDDSPITTFGAVA